MHIQTKMKFLLLFIAIYIVPISPIYAQSVCNVTNRPPTLVNPIIIEISNDSPTIFVADNDRVGCSGQVHSFNIPVNRDVKVVMKPGSAPLTRPLWINGGRNAHIVGIESRPSIQPGCGVGQGHQVRATQFKNIHPRIPGNKAFRFEQEGTTFIEGVDIDLNGAEADCFVIRNDGRSAGRAGDNFASQNRNVGIVNTRCVGIEGHDDSNTIGKSNYIGDGIHGDFLQNQGKDSIGNFTAENVTIRSASNGTTLHQWNKTAPNLNLRNFDYAADARFYGDDPYDRISQGLALTGGKNPNLSNVYIDEPRGLNYLLLSGQNRIGATSGGNVTANSNIKAGLPPVGQFAPASKTGLEYRSPFANNISEEDSFCNVEFTGEDASEGGGLSEAELQALRDETAALVPEPFEAELEPTAADVVAAAAAQGLDISAEEITAAVEALGVEAAAAELGVEITATDDQLKTEWVKAFVMMTDQFSHMMVQQVQAIGQFFDAKHQLETQQLFQQRVAEAHKDYHPSEQICEIGTFVRDLADAEERTKITRNVIAQAPLSRELGSGLVKTFDGIKESDARTRRDLYRSTFCSIYDNAQNNELICGTTPGGPGGESQASSKARLNADLNYTQTIDLPLTLNVDFTDGVTSDEETNIFAMLDQIFMNTPFPALSSQKTVLHNFVKPYQEMRSLIAIRSVAQNSFAHIIAEKTIGAENDKSVTPFIYALLEEMGMNSYEGTSHHGDTIANYLGERPSYHAQMEVLTKKIFQHPEFISNLYDKPANVKRIKTALNAIKLMQDRDIQQAMMRREMLTSMVLELRLRTRQNKLANQVEGVLSQPPGEAIDIYGVSGQRSRPAEGF